MAFLIQLITEKFIYTNMLIPAQEQGNIADIRTDFQAILKLKSDILAVIVLDVGIGFII